MGHINSVQKDGCADCTALHRRIADLDQSLEQALVSLEDVQDHLHVLVEERDAQDQEITVQRAENIRLRMRLAEVETAREVLMRSLLDADASVRKVRIEGVHLTEELQASYEELQNMAQQLEEANADLEMRVAERTADLAEANIALRNREEQLRFAQQCAKAGTWDWDVAADQLVWSPECCELLGMNPRTDRPSLDRLMALIVPEDREPLSKAIADRLLTDEDEFRLEYRVRHARHGIRWITAIGRVVWRDLQGRPTRVTGLAFDVTDRRVLEEELRRARDVAETANQSKTRFLAAASHDLRQPLQAAALYAHVLESSIRSSAKGMEVLNLLKASIESLNGMLSGMLDLSRLEAGTVEVKIANVAVDSILTRLTGEFAAVADASGMDLRILPCNAGITTDPRLFERVLRNLIANALAHGRSGEPGGRVLVGTRRRKNAIEFQVWDNGPGIPESAREAIFEEFRQLTNPERSSARGFGLGLSIVDRIARLLNLKVSLWSEVGRGSVFSIQVAAQVAAPVASAPRAATTRPVAPASSLAMASWLRGRTILLVEDDEQVRRGLTMMLKRWGVRVSAVSSAEELAARLPRLRRQPHAVLTDYRLPNGNTGRLVVELVRKRWNVPGIIITGDTAPERLREAMSIGCRLLHKPIAPSELMGALGEALQSGWPDANNGS